MTAGIVSHVPNWPGTQNRPITRTFLVNRPEAVETGGIEPPSAVA